MCRISVLVLCLTVTTAHLGYSQDVPQETTQTRLKEGEKKISETILDILAHYKKSDPVGLPDSLSGYVPDPFPVPDIKQTVSFTTIVLKNTSLYGIRNFRIVGVNAEIGAMEVHAELVMDKLQARGNYTMSSWVNRAQGPYTVDVTAVNVKGRGTLGVERDGKLRAQDIKIDLSFDKIEMNFENLGFLASMFQGVINSLGPVIFDSIKPYILKEAYTKVRSEINVKLDDVAGDMQFPNSISPLDMVIVDARKKVREMNLDPYQVKDYNTSMSIFSITLTHTWITGISSFHRVGNISLLMENNTVIADFEIGTQKLQGTTQWDIYAIGGLMSRAGTASFSVQYISGRIILAQPLDVRKTPEFRNLELEVGNIQVRCDGAGTLDYVIEFAVNVLPNLLRYQIMDALENPIKEKIQQELDKVNVEEYILQELPKTDAMQESGFKLSALVEPKSEDKPYDEDDFFNF